MVVEISPRQAIRSQEIADLLESIVDKFDIANVINALTLVCSEKADHIWTNWQDAKLAARWEECAAALLNAELLAP